MSLVRRFARPLLAAVFVQDGVDTFLHPKPRVEATRPLAARAAGLGLPADPELLVRGTGAVMAVAGGLFALGRLPRVSALAMVATLAPATYVEHPFWQEKEATARRAQRQAFLRNLGLLGGTLLATVDTEGRPGLAWRGRDAASRAGRGARRAARTARRSAKVEAREAVRAAKDALPV